MIIMAYVIILLQDVNGCGVEAQICFFPHLIDPLVLGIEIGEPYKGISHHHMIILIASHEAGEDDLAGKLPFLGDDGAFRPQDYRTFIALLQCKGKRYLRAADLHDA